LLLVAPLPGFSRTAPTPVLVLVLFSVLVPALA